MLRKYGLKFTEKVNYAGCEAKKEHPKYRPAWRANACKKEGHVSHPAPQYSSKNPNKKVEISKKDLKIEFVERYAEVSNIALGIEPEEK